jgi:hypothetical protein
MAGSAGRAASCFGRSSRRFCFFSGGVGFTQKGKRAKGQKGKGAKARRRNKQRNVDFDGQPLENAFTL